MSESSTPSTSPTHIRQRDEAPLLVLSALYFFCVLAGYYILRPIRDEISAEDRGNLQTLWTAVFLIMLIAVPLYAALTARFSRRRFVPLVYHFFVSNILVFYVLIQTLPQDWLIYLDRVFYVWVSVFNLFVVSVFWQLMADVYSSAQAKRLFGVIALGGTLGGVAGSAAVSILLDPPGALQFLQVRHTTLMLVSALLLEGACLCIYAINQMTRRSDHLASEHVGTSTSIVDQPVRGTVAEGIGVVFRSPYLLGICLFLLLYCTLSTFLYFQQADIIKEAFSENRDGRRALFARIDLSVNLLTMFIQCFLTGRIMTRLGVGAALIMLPAVALIGFALLGVASLRPEVVPILWVLVAFQICRRASNYALAKPAREALFTVVSRQEKYKSKAFIDAVVYRGSDTASGWIYTGLAALGMGLASIAFLAVPIAGIWIVVAFLLGRKQQELAAASAPPAS